MAWLLFFFVSVVATGVTVVPGAFIPGSQPDGNSVVIDAPDGVIIVDTGRHPEHTAAVLAAAKGKPVVAVVNTHWHLDHVGGNPAVRKAFPKAKIYASDAIRAARTGFLANYQKQLEEVLAGEKDAEKQKAYRAELDLIAAGPALEPDEVVSASGTKTIGGKKLEVHLEKNAVTAGDLWLYDPATKTLVAGDLVTLPVPFMDTACPANWQKALANLAAKDFQRLVPGHGAPMTKTDLGTYRTAFAKLIACGGSKSDKSVCVDGWIRDATPLLGDADTKQTRILADYYVDAVLRGDLSARCSQLPARK